MTQSAKVAYYAHTCTCTYMYMHVHTHTWPDISEIMRHLFIVATIHIENGVDTRTLRYNLSQPSH